MKFNVYGRKIEIVRDDGKWVVFILGSGGKKRTAQDIFIPSNIAEDDLDTYLEDLLHELATPDNDEIFRIY
jgi:hypothetical protein